MGRKYRHDKHLLIDEKVLAIRQNGNPQRLFSNGTTVGELGRSSYQDIVTEFERRLVDWYFNIGATIADHPDSNVILTSISCIIIDLLSQFIYCKPASSKQIFQKFFREYFFEYEQPLRPPIKTCYFHKGRWMQEEIRSVSAGFYHCFRCGVVHSGRILEYGRFSRTHSKVAVAVKTWKANRRIGTEIEVNPVVLLGDLRAVFNGYIAELRRESPHLKKNFITKFRIEYGIDIG